MKEEKKRSAQKVLEKKAQVVQLAAQDGESYVFDWLFGLVYVLLYMWSHHLWTIVTSQVLDVLHLRCHHANNIDKVQLMNFLPNSLQS